MTPNILLVCLASAILIASTAKAIRGQVKDLLTDSSSQIVLATFAYTVLPSAIDQFATNRRLYDEVRGAYIPLSPVGSATQSFLLFLLIGTLFLVLMRTISSRQKPSLAGILITTSVLSVVVATLTQGAQVGLGLIMLLAVCAVATLSHPTQLVALSIQLATSSLLLVSAVATFYNPGLTFVPCRVDKCNEIGEFYSGLWTNPNGFALLVALSGMWFLSGKSTAQRVLSGSAIAILLIAAGSRTAQIAALVGLFLYILAGRANQRRLKLAGMLTVGVWSVSLIPIFVPFDDSQFTQRGLLWSAAKTGILSHPFGQGADAWRDLYELYNSIISSGTYSAHNEILDVAFRGGIVAAIALLVAVLNLAVRFSRSSPDSGRLGISALGVAGALSLLERPWGMSSVDWLTFTLIILILFGERNGLRVSLAAGGDRAMDAQRA